MITDEWRLRLENYLDGVLTAEEQAAVEQALEDDDELYAELNVLRLEREAKRLAYEDALRQQVVGWFHEAAAQETPVRTLRTRRRWLPLLSAAASALLLLGFFGFQRARTLYSNDALLGQFDTRTTRSDIAPNTPTERAFQAFERDSFQQALELLREVEAPGYTEYLLEAEAYMKLEDFSAASQSLQQAQGQTSNDIELQQLDWKLAGVFLAQGDEQQAIRQLDLILANPRHDFYEPAQELRRRLKSPWRKLVR